MADSRLTYTLQDFISSGNNTDTLSYNNLSFTEKSNGIKFTVANILRDYLYELKELCQTIELSESEVYKYSYNPKVLANDIYNNPELGFLILLLNDMCNIKEFTLSTGTVKLLTQEDVANQLPKIYSAEKSSMQVYNNK